MVVSKAFIKETDRLSSQKIRDDHRDADEILIDILGKLGLHKTVEAWKEVRWYA